MAVSHRGAISFGMIHIPVGLYIATAPAGIRFNQLYRETNERIRYKKAVPGVNEDVKPEQIVKGYEYEKDKYVVMEDSDFEKIKVDQDKNIHILHFTDVAQIDPVYFEKAYYSVPESGSDKAYELLRKTMITTGKAAIAKTVLGTRETLMALLAKDDGIMVESLFYQAEIRPIPKSYSRPEISEVELTMAVDLAHALTKPWQPELYRDEYQERLRAAIQAKINGEEIVAAPVAEQAGAVDLMEALKATMQQVIDENRDKLDSAEKSGEKPAKGRKTTRTAKTQ